MILARLNREAWIFYPRVANKSHRHHPRWNDQLRFSVLNTNNILVVAISKLCTFWIPSNREDELIICENIFDRWLFNSPSIHMCNAALLPANEYGSTQTHALHLRVLGLAFAYTFRTQRCNPQEVMHSPYLCDLIYRLTPATTKKQVCNINLRMCVNELLGHLPAVFALFPNTTISDYYSSTS